MVVVHSLVCGVLRTLLWFSVMWSRLLYFLIMSRLSTGPQLIATFDPTPADVVDFGETRCDPLLSILVQFWPNFLLWILE